MDFPHSLRVICPSFLLPASFVAPVSLPRKQRRKLHQVEETYTLFLFHRESGLHWQIYSNNKIKMQKTIYVNDK